MSRKACYCGSGRDFFECCSPFLERHQLPSSPEQLMRSRFSAFCEKNLDYLMATTDPQTRLDFDFDATREWAEAAEFLKLEVLRSTQEGNKGIVEFKAHYRMPNESPTVHHELSKFRKQAGHWYFREGRVFAPEPTV